MAICHLFFVDMKEMSVEQINLIIEQELRQGRTHKEIASKVHKTAVYVQNVKNKLIESGQLLESDIKQGKEQRKKQEFMADSTIQQILSYARQGLSQQDIEYELKVKQTTISFYLRKAKEYGLITQEEIDRARLSYRQEVRYDDLRRDLVYQALLDGKLKYDFAKEIGLSPSGARVIQDSLIEEGRITQEQIDEAVARRGKEVQRKNRAIELFRQGYMNKEISEELGYYLRTVTLIKQAAISEGKLTEEEYIQARKERLARLEGKPKKTHQDNSELIEQTLQLLRQGKNMSFLRKKTGQNAPNMRNIIKKMIAEGYITQSEIDEAREKNAKELERKILIGLRRGQTQREIQAMFEEGEYSLTLIQERINQLKQTGKINDEEIKRYKYEAEQGEKELQEFVLSGIIQGLSRVEMAKRDETGYFTETKIKWAIRKMKQQGILTEKDLENYRNRKIKNKKAKGKKLKRDRDRNMIQLIQQGYSIEEIAAKLGYAESSVRGQITNLKKQGKLTNEGIKQARNNKRNEEQKEKDSILEGYKENLRKIGKIYYDNAQHTDDKINEVIRKLLVSANYLVGKGDYVTSEHLKLMLDTLLCARKIDVNNVIGIAGIHVKMEQLQSAMYTLNYSRSLFSEESELKKIDQATQTLVLYRKKREAMKLLQNKCPVDVIEQRTKLGIAEILALQNNANNSAASKEKLIQDLIYPKVHGE